MLTYENNNNNNNNNNNKSGSQFSRVDDYIFIKDFVRSNVRQ